MNPSTIRNKLASLGISPAQYDFGWEFSRPVIWFGEHVMPLPLDDCQDEAFATDIADAVANPQKYTSIDILRRIKNEP